MCDEGIIGSGFVVSSSKSGMVIIMYIYTPGHQNNLSLGNGTL